MFSYRPRRRSHGPETRTRALVICLVRGPTTKAGICRSVRVVNPSWGERQSFPMCVTSTPADTGRLLFFYAFTKNADQLPSDRRDGSNSARPSSISELIPYPVLRRHAAIGTYNANRLSLSLHSRCTYKRVLFALMWAYGSTRGTVFEFGGRNTGQPIAAMQIQRLYTFACTRARPFIIPILSTTL